MDPVLVEIYRTVIDAAPYVLAAYVLLWLGMMGYIVLRRAARERAREGDRGHRGRRRAGAATADA